MHQRQHHREIREQEPIDRLTHQPAADQPLIDQPVAAQQRHPGNHADHVRRPERDSAEHKEQRLHLPAAHMEGDKVGHREADYQRDQPDQQAELEGGQIGFEGDAQVT